MTLNLVYYPDPILKDTAKPIETVTDQHRQHLDDMLQIMYDHHGIGLAGNQAGLLNRLVVMDVRESENAPRNPIKMINPEIIEASEEESKRQEGCLSLPGIYGDVTRPAHITVQYLDEHGDKQTLEAEGLLSACIQHEIDHLDGVLFVDHLSKLKRDMLLKKLKKILKDIEEQ